MDSKEKFINEQKGYIRLSDISRFEVCSIGNKEFSIKYLDEKDKSCGWSEHFNSKEEAEQYLDNLIDVIEGRENKLQATILDKINVLTKKVARLPAPTQHRLKEAIIIMDQIDLLQSLLNE